MRSVVQGACHPPVPVLGVAQVTDFTGFVWRRAQSGVAGVSQDGNACFNCETRLWNIGLMSVNPAVTPAAPDSAPRILAIGFLRLKQLLYELAPEYALRSRVDVVDRGFDEALAEIESRRASEGVDVLVAAGLHGDFLRSRTDLPVVMVKVGGFGLMLALAHARSLSSRIALVSFGTERDEVEQFSRGFGLDIEQRSYRSETDAAACVRELRDAGIEVVVAPGMVLDHAEKLGMRGVLLYSHDAVRAALDDAVEIARAARIAAAKRERLNTILEQLRDGVVAVDEAERIEAVNPPMQRLLGRTRQQLLGRVLGDVAPEFTLARTLRDGVEQAEDIVRFGAQTLVISRTPIVERGVRTGAVLSCQDPAAIQRVDRSLRARARPAPTVTRWRLSDLIGDSAAMRRAREQAGRFARGEATVLIEGESGTGKELFAQGIHAASRRRAQPFVAINCAAFPESLLESELFGYEEGAFTGARKAGKPGLFEAAHTGTLFLDEIGDMPVSLQTRLLRVLQEREILRVGATEPTPVDVRVVAATHRDLASRIEAGLFRRDLYYRLNILRLELPSLRERREDLPALASHLLDKALARAGTPASAREPLLRGLLRLLGEAGDYAWPGNVRELENLCERVAGAVGDDAQGLDPRLLHELLPELARAGPTAAPGGPAAPLARRRAQSELELIRRVLDECAGNQAQACARLGISRSTLWRRLRAGA